jgi:hypothetical protein
MMESATLTLFPTHSWGPSPAGAPPHPIVRATNLTSLLVHFHPNPSHYNSHYKLMLFTFSSYKLVLIAISHYKPNLIALQSDYTFAKPNAFTTSLPYSILPHHLQSPLPGYFPTWVSTLAT